MSEANLYKRIVTPQAVERAMAATLALWMPDYIGELERIEDYDVGQIALPEGYITASQFAKWPPDQLPLILVLSPGLAKAPARQHGSSYEAEWRIDVVGIVSDTDEENTRQLASAYAGAIRSAVLQHKMLKSSLHPDGFAQFTKWRDEKYSDIDFADSRTLDSCKVSFTVGVEDVVTEQAGPREPSSEPGVDPGPLRKVEKVEVTVEPEALLV